jgi:hypothetical protein
MSGYESAHLISIRLESAKAYLVRTHQFQSCAAKSA